ncbi:MAG: GtrA family protein [Micrococcales bacterium]|nr:GtrA family protein [Micrococcales bacterium]
MSILTRLSGLTRVGTRFLTVGAISTLIEIVLFNLLFVLLGWDVVSAKVTASLVALVNAYLGNRQWTFRERSRRALWVEIALFLVVNALCTLLGALIVWVGVEWFPQLLGHPVGALAVNLVNLFSIAVVVLARFALYHRLVFPVRRARLVADEPEAPSREA